MNNLLHITVLIGILLSNNTQYTQTHNEEIWENKIKMRQNNVFDKRNVFFSFVDNQKTSHEIFFPICSSQ